MRSPTPFACATLALVVPLGAQSILAVDGRVDLGPLDSQAYTTSVHALDFDRDGRLDLLFGGELAYTVAVPPLRRGVGDGRFEPVPGFSFWNRTAVGAVADLDGNGTVEFSNPTGLWTIAADGTPTRFLAWSLDPDLLRFGDVDGDGDLDIVRVASGSLVTHTQTGPLQFTQTGSVPVAGVGTALALGDLTGDSWPDVLVTARNAAVQLFENDGSGAFVDVSHRLQANTGTQTRCGLHDLDQDGSDEVVLLDTGGGSLQVFTPQGASYADISTRFAVTPAVHVGYAVGDVDGDGLPDLIVVDEVGGQVLRNTSSGWFVPVAGGWPGSADHLCAALVDVDADGDLDLVEGGKNLHDRVHFNDGAGRFVGPGTGRQLLRWSGAPQDRYVVTADIDRDGDVDLLGPDAFWRNDGFGRFSEGPSGAPPNPNRLPEAVAWGRVDGDAHIDLVVPTGFDRFRVFHGDGRGGFLPGTEHQAPISAQGNPGPPTAAQHIAVLALNDLDRDGDLDLVCGAHPTRWDIGSAPALDTIWWNDGAGNLTEDRQWCVTNAQFGKAVAFGDLDGDGLTDFTDGMASFLQRPDGRFDHVAPDPNGWLYTGTEGPVALADLDLDGDLDVVEANACAGRPFCEGEPDVIGWNDGTGRFLRESLVDEQDSRALALFDADDDGDVDIFFGRYDSGIHRQGINVLLLNEGNRVFRPARLDDEVPEVWRTTWHLGLGDFDSDGDEDVFTLDATLDDQNPYGTLWFGMTRHLRAPDLLRVGRTFRLELHGAALGGAIYGSPALGRVDLPIVGRFGLDPGTTAMFGAYGAPSQGRRVDVDLRVPAETALLGVQYGFQGLVLGTTGTVRLTNRLVDRFVGQ